MVSHFLGVGCFTFLTVFLIIAPGCASPEFVSFVFTDHRYNIVEYIWQWYCTGTEFEFGLVDHIIKKIPCKLPFLTTIFPLEAQFPGHGGWIVQTKLPFLPKIPRISRESKFTHVFH